MPRDYKVYMEDILGAIDKVRRYIAGLSFETLSRDEKTLDAVIRNLEVIGEAVKNIPKKIRSKHSDVDWQKIAGLRDILIHEYFGIDLEIIWDIQYFTKWRLMAHDLSGYPLAVRAGFPRPATRWDKADGRGDRALTPVRYIA